MKTDKILIVADDSPSAIKAIRYGFDLACDLNASVALLYVIESALAEGNVDAGIFPDQAAEKLKLDAEKFLNNMQQEYGQGIPTTLMTPEGEVKKTVVDIAGSWDAKLIVTGTHGRTGLNKLFMGSVSDSIIHNSNVPVCVVPK